MRTHVLILGASGRIARWVVRELAGDAAIQQTLSLRHPRNLRGKVPANAKVVEGDVLDPTALSHAMVDQQIVYANLTGDDIDEQATAVIAARKQAGIARLVFVTSLGIYDEVPGKFGAWNRREIGAYLPPFRRAADAIEASGLDYTILHPAWLQDEDDVDYEITGKDQAFKGTKVSRHSVADLIAKIVR